MISLSEKEIDALLSAGAAAPSGGNVQPWKVTIQGDDTFQIDLDPKRSTSFLDVGHYASLFAIGCFVENVCLTADRLGLSYKVAIGKNVHIRFTARGKAATVGLDRYIFSRLTNRQLSDGTEIGNNVIDSLEQELAKNTSTRVTFINKLAIKAQAAGILGKADAIRILHDKLFSQMMDELRWNSDETQQTKDGLDVKTLEMPPNMLATLDFLRKNSGARKLIPAQAIANTFKIPVIMSSHLGCLILKKKRSPESMIEAGRAMQRLWLATGKANLALQPWTVITFFNIRCKDFAGEGFSPSEKKAIVALTSQLGNIFGVRSSETPLFVFRLSKAKPPTERSLRLDWHSFTTRAR